MKLEIDAFFKSLLFKVNDDHFYNALKITFCAIIIFVFFLNEDNYTLALGMILGISLSSPIDISSNLKDKIFGLSIASITVPVITLLLTYSYSYVFLFYVVFAFFVFVSALISMYGLRATQFSYMLLLAICLSFLDISNEGNSITNSIHMFYGGALYLIVSVLFYLIRPTKYIDLQLAICIDRISQYLRLRSQLWDEKADIDKIEEKQLALQVQIDDSFQIINEFLEINKRKIINSRHNRKVILASSFINEIMELALSTVFSNDDIKTEIDSQPNLRVSIQQLTNGFAINLEELADAIKLQNKFKPSIDLIQSFGVIQSQFDQYKKLNPDEQIYIDNMQDYFDSQITKIRSLERVFTEEISVSDLSVNSDEIKKYFTPHEYRFKTLLENLNFKSIYFRYATRLSITMLIGLAIGSFNQFKQEYWILSTIVLIMQTSYGLTKARMNERIIGTILAGLFGIFILYFITKRLDLTILTTLAMLLSVWYSSSKYFFSVIFNTLYMILLYGILKTGTEINFLYRIIDTLTGAILAFLATNYLWPSWEFLSIKKNLVDSIESSKSYINVFRNIYIRKKTDDFDLQQSRQNAFIAIGNLMASYQRLVQEPKSKQQNRAQLYQIAVLNQSLIGAVASLGNFIRSHQDNDDFKSFSKIFNTIIYNLDTSLNSFDKAILKDSDDQICSTSEIINMQADQNNQLKLLESTDTEKLMQLEESKLVLTQLNWIVSLSEQILKTSQTIK